MAVKVKRGPTNRVAEFLNGEGKKKAGTEHVVIAPPKLATISLRVIGTAPLVMNCFSEKARQQIKDTQEKGEQAKKGKKREPKDFQKAYESAMHVSTQGWHGIPATAFRAAMINACRMVGFAMTRAKCSIFVIADGYDKADQSPLVKITKGTPRYVEHAVRPEKGGVDIRPRPMWDAGWECELCIEFDMDQFSVSDVVNLAARAGVQVGILEGRPYSKKGMGMGWGTFRVEQVEGGKRGK